MAHRTTVEFRRGDTAVEVPGPPATNGQSLANWVTSQSEGFRRWSYRGTDKYAEQWTIRLSSLTEAQYNAFRSFFWDEAQGPTNEFTYTHTDAKQYAARFVDTDLRWNRGSRDEWDVTVLLEVFQQRINEVTTSSTTTTTSTTTSIGDA